MENKGSFAIDALNAKYDLYAKSIKELKDIKEYLSKCKDIELLSNPKTGVAFMHVINKKGAEEIVQANYIQSLLKNVSAYGSELKENLLPNDEFRKALEGLEQSKKGLRR